MREKPRPPIQNVFATSGACSRRDLFRSAALLAAVGAGAGMAPSDSRQEGSHPGVPVVDITDLYHPPQDPGDNLDLIAAYALKGVDLKAVILDVTDRYRRPYLTENGQFSDPAGGRDPGFIPVLQLNAIFGRNVPCAAAPYHPLRHPEDQALDAPPFQQQGIDLLLRTLADTAEPVHVVSFGSARPLAIAYNREPRLLRDKVARVHLCAGGAPRGYLEWNVNLDPHAFVRILRSDLPVALYPCATERDVFESGPFNTFWRLADLQFVRDLAPPLQRYVAYAFGRSSRTDFLAAIEDEPAPEILDRIAASPHNVWETAVWIEVANLRLVRREDGAHRILPAGEVLPTDRVLSGGLLPCTVDVSDDGQFDFEITRQDTHFWIYHRDDPQGNAQALVEALPALYRSFQP